MFLLPDDVRDFTVVTYELAFELIVIHCIQKHYPSGNHHASHF